MNARRLLASLLAGLVVSLAVGVGLTAALDPYIWPAALLALPVGVVAGVATVALAYVWLGYREERRRGNVSTRTAARLWTTVAAIVAFVGVGGLAVAALWTLALGLATAILFGGVVGAVAAAVAAVVVFRRVRQGPPSRGSVP